MEEGWENVGDHFGDNNDDDGDNTDNDGDVNLQLSDKKENNISRDEATRIMHDELGRSSNTLFFEVERSLSLFLIIKKL